MSRPINLQRRLNNLVAVPTAIGGAALLVIAISQFGGSTGMAVVALLGALALGVAAYVALRRTSSEVFEAVADTAAKGEALVAGRAVSAESAAFLEELEPVNTALAELSEQQRVLRAQSEAITAGAFDSPILDSELSGPVGEALRNSIAGFRVASEKLRDSQAVNASIMDNVSDAIVVVNNKREIVAANAVAQVALDLFGGDLDQTLPGWFDLPMGEHDFSRTLADGTLTLTQIATTRMITADGAVTVLCWRDVSGERAVQAQIAHVALTDIVTGLPNRQGLLAAFDRLHELGRSASVIHVDLAGFSEVNERHGFPAGDRVLQELSTRLRSIIRDHDTVARLGGDEFVFVLESQRDAVDILAHRVLDRVREPITLDDGANVVLNAHAGWVFGPVDGDYELLRRATYALAEAKTNGPVTSYSDEIAERDLTRRDWENQLRRAIAEDEFVLYAQPIVDVFERRVLGVEIFLRWQHPSGRLITPAEFISIAEESELIADIDRWVIRSCVREAAEADPNLVFSLNVSTRFMSGSTMAEFVRQTLADTGLAAGRIQIDVTETNVAADAQGVVDSIRSLNDMGVKVALDDFGSGYSSLAHLLKLAVSTIKIDRRMVGMVGEPEGRGVVSAILAFAGKRDLHVVAEGVETEQEAAELAELGCRYQQGYHHSRPAPLAEVLTSLHTAGVADAPVGELPDLAAELAFAEPPSNGTLHADAADTFAAQPAPEAVAMAPAPAMPEPQVPADTGAEPVAFSTNGHVQVF